MTELSVVFLPAIAKAIAFAGGLVLTFDDAKGLKI